MARHHVRGKASHRWLMGSVSEREVGATDAGRQVAVGSFSLRRDDLCASDSWLPASARTMIGAALLIHAFGASAAAQWKEFPTPGLPRTADGKPNLAAPAPRMPDGTPDLSGVWRIRQGTYFIYITSALKSGDIQPWAQAKYEERAQDFRRDSNGIKCLPPGPNAATSGVALPLKIVQTPHVVVMLYEYQTLYRQIFTDGRTLPEDPNPTWMGYSVGHWEGETLVATTRG